MSKIRCHGSTDEDLEVRGFPIAYLRYSDGSEPMSITNFHYTENKAYAYEFKSEEEANKFIEEVKALHSANLYHNYEVIE